jgi:hypothetical protein
MLILKFKIMFLLKKIVMIKIKEIKPVMDYTVILLCFAKVLKIFRLSKETTKKIAD